MEDRNDWLSAKIANAIIISGILVFISIIGLFVKSKNLHEKYKDDVASFKKEVMYAQQIAILASNINRFSGNLMTVSNKSEIDGLKKDIKKNEEELRGDIDEIKAYKTADALLGDSLSIFEKRYLKTNRQFLSIIDSGKIDEARTFNHDIRRPLYDKFQAQQELFFSSLSENTSSFPKTGTIWSFNAYWFLLIIGLLPLSILFIIIVYFLFRVVIGEIVGV